MPTSDIDRRADALIADLKRRQLAEAQEYGWEMPVEDQPQPAWLPMPDDPNRQMQRSDLWAPPFESPLQALERGVQTADPLIQLGLLTSGTVGRLTAAPIKYAAKQAMKIPGAIRGARAAQSLEGLAGRLGRAPEELATVRGGATQSRELPFNMGAMENPARLRSRIRGGRGMAEAGEQARMSRLQRRSVGAAGAGELPSAQLPAEFSSVDDVLERAPLPNEDTYRRSVADYFNAPGDKLALAADAPRPHGSIMPIRKKTTAAPEPIPAPSGIRRRTVPTEEESAAPIGAGLAGIGAILGAAALRKPQLAKTALGKLGNAFNTARMTSMLSGLAVPKSILGNVGATAIESAERGSMAPLKELFSGQTVRDFGRAIKSGGQVGPIPGSSRMNPFGRVMGAGDVATRNAMQRAGMTAGEAQTAVLQDPLPGSLGTALESTAGQYLVPFRRTPFNQFIQGFETLKGEHPRVLGGVAAAGAAHGAATSDEPFPISIGLGTALAAKYGLPYAAAAYVGRRLAGSKTGGGIPSAMVPVSEYGFEQALDEPLTPLDPRESAAVRAIRRIRGE